MGQRKAALSVDSLSWTVLAPPHPKSIRGGARRTRQSPAHPGCLKLPSAVGGGPLSGRPCGPGSSPGLGWFGPSPACPVLWMHPGWDSGSSIAFCRALNTGVVSSVCGHLSHSSGSAKGLSTVNCNLVSTRLSGEAVLENHVIGVHPQGLAQCWYAVDMLN